MGKRTHMLEKQETTCLLAKTETGLGGCSLQIADEGLESASVHDQRN